MPIDPSVLLKAQPVDVAAGVQEGATANLASTRAQDVRMQLEDTQQTNQALKDYLSVDGADLYTSKGIEEAMPKLKGRIPPKAYFVDRASLKEEGHVRDLLCRSSRGDESSPL